MGAIGASISENLWYRITDQIRTRGGVDTDRVVDAVAQEFKRNLGVIQVG
jgi:hypothetical protein